MYIQVINVNKPEHKNYIGEIYKVKKEVMDINNKECYSVYNIKRIFEKKNCIILNNVIEFKRK